MDFGGDGYNDDDDDCCNGHLCDGDGDDHGVCGGNGHDRDGDNDCDEVS